MDQNGIDVEIRPYPTQRPLKPRMLCFQTPFDHLAPTLIEPLIQKIVKALGHYFELVIVRESCDYSEQVEKHMPDIVLFDGTIESTVTRRLSIRNTNTHQHIPRVGLIRIDALSPSRANFAAEMEQWGVETFFTNVDTAMGEAFSEIADQLFYWPMFIDPEVFRDYGYFKSVPVLMVGNFDGPIPSQYIWRVSVREPLLTNLPCLYFRHPGYDPNNFSPLALRGTQYAKVLNTAWFAPTCGAMKKILVSKHLELPGAGACLVTEDTEAVRAFGFRDMENCVLADAKNIVEKLTGLLEKKDDLLKILNNGYALVHNNHTLYHRPQIVQWLQLKLNLQPGYKIVQPDLFGDLVAVPADSPVTTRHITGATDTALIRAGNQNLLQGNVAVARYFFEEALKYVFYLGEANLGLGICALLEGQPQAALELLSKPLGFVFHFTGFEPDPIEWAFLIVGVLCSGDANQAADYCRKFKNVTRTELTAARWMALVASGAFTEAAAEIQLWQSREGEGERKTYHGSIPRFTVYSFVEFALKLLKANQQTGFIEALELKIALLPIHRGSSENVAET
jgi:hypothetical protein